jgi:steroid delta-isomerase-like uncharacterized protein
MPAGTATENMALVRAAFDALRRKDMDACTSFMTPDFLINLVGMPHQMHGPGAWRSNAALFFMAFPDFQLMEEDMFAAGDRVAVRVRFTGTHSGEFMGTPATGKRVDYQSFEIYRIADGRIAEEWICSDLLTILTQIGALERGRLASMWLAGYRVWFAAALGLIAGGAATFAAMAILA